MNIEQKIQQYRDICKDFEKIMGHRVTISNPGVYIYHGAVQQITWPLGMSTPNEMIMTVKDESGEIHTESIGKGSTVTVQSYNPKDDELYNKYIDELAQLNNSVQDLPLDDEYKKLVSKIVKKAFSLAFKVLALKRDSVV